MPAASVALHEIRGIIAAHARPDMRTAIDGLLLSRIETQEPDHSLTDPLLVVMAQGGKRLLLGDRVFEYRAGQCLVVTTALPVTGHFLGATRETPSLAMGIVLRPAAIAALLLEPSPEHRPTRTGPHSTEADAPGPRADGSHTPGSHTAGSHGAGSHGAGSHGAGSHTAGSHTAGSHTAGSHTAGSHTAGSHTAGSHTAGSHTAGAQTGPGLPAIGTCDAGPDLLDAVARMLRLLDHPSDAHVLAPMIEREILWRLITGPHGGIVRQIGLADSRVSHVGRAIRWIRVHYAEPMRIEDLARLAGMSAPSLHRHFRAVTTMSPLQFQKRIRLQEARSLLVSGPAEFIDVAGVAGIGHLVGYDSPSQFSREYRRLFGTPPGRDAALLRTTPGPQRVRHLP